MQIIEERHVNNGMIIDVVSDADINNVDVMYWLMNDLESRSVIYYHEKARMKLCSEELVRHSNNDAFPRGEPMELIRKYLIIKE